MKDATQFLNDGGHTVVDKGAVFKLISSEFTGMPKLAKIVDGPWWSEWNNDIYYNVLDVLKGKSYRLSWSVIERDYETY